MRLLIYLLAMLTGFSAAEAARPVAAASPSVDTAIAHCYAAVAVKAAEQVPPSPVSAALSVAKPVAEPALAAIHSPVRAGSPVLRHDIILG